MPRSGSQSSSNSIHQRAMRRGSGRGRNEATDATIAVSLEEMFGDRQPGTQSTDKVTDETGRWTVLKKFQRRTSKSALKQLAAELSNEAWMCGVCAKSFSSFAAAQKHEDFHILEVISDLGWGAPLQPVVPDEQSHSSIDNLESTNTADPSTPIRATSQINLSDRLTVSHRMNSSPCPRPDMLHMSSTPLSISGRVSMQPYNTPALQRKKRFSRRNSFEDTDDDASRSTNTPNILEYDLTTSIVKPMSKMPMSPIHELRLHDKNRQHNQKQKLSIEVHNDAPDWTSHEHDLLVPQGMRNCIVLADEALADVCQKATALILSPQEEEAELELHYLAQDKAYYDMLQVRSVDRRRGGTYSHFRAEGKSILSKVQNKFVDAYQLMKEGKAKNKSTTLDHYTRKVKGDIDTIHILENNDRTLYVNVIVKASLKVVSHELQRLAKQRWEAAQAKKDGYDPQTEQFQQFRALAQDNLVKLAGLALAADFTPRRIAVQLSNDFYRLLTPRLKRRGVLIETEIEYRVGPYFVLAVNINKVDWRRVVKAAYRDVTEAKSRWRREQQEKNDEDNTEQKPRGVILSFIVLCYALTKMTEYEVIAQVLAWCYYFHWTIYTPICFLLYHSFLGQLLRRYFLASVTDEIFYYVEQKGMEMDIVIRNSSTQASFMLSALREIRADGRELKKQQQGVDDKGIILGPLLGPAIKEDKGPAPPMPAGFVMPDSLEDVGLEIDLPVGFRRLRWALLSSKSSFVTDAIFKTESKYENIKVGSWSKHDDVIGLATLPDGIKEEDIIGAERELSYLMPKSAFVKANMCYETAFIDVYNDYCFVLRKRAHTPDVPYGSTFLAWTKYVVINTGSDTCKLTCSVEAEFPNGPPMISRQIKGGMRAGVGELFVRTGETINKYAEVYA